MISLVRQGKPKLVGPQVRHKWMLTSNNSNNNLGKNLCNQVKKMIAFCISQ